MKAIITGDIIDSQQVADGPEKWLIPLKKLFKSFGDTPEVWEIYRGDSFQIETDPADGLRVAILIKAVIKKIEYKHLDVRLAIGIGDVKFKRNRVAESTGDAFIFSGKLLDNLKDQKVHLGIKSKWPDFDDNFNVMLKLALVIMNGWSNNSAEVAELMFREPMITQQQMAKRLGIAQSSVNERIKRAALYEIIEFEHYYKKRIQSYY